MPARYYETVTISLKNNDKIKVHPPKVRLKVDEDKGVEWVADPEEMEFDVFFSETPFETADFKKGKNKSSAPVPEKLPQGVNEKEFKYSVKVGSLIEDPGVIILR